MKFTGNGSQVSSASALGSLLVDNGVETLGHRRWMLHPFLGTTSLGRVDGTPPGSPYFYTGVSLKVVGGAAPCDRAGYLAGWVDPAVAPATRTVAGGFSRREREVAGAH